MSQPPSSTPIGTPAAPAPEAPVEAVSQDASPSTLAGLPSAFLLRTYYLISLGSLGMLVNYFPLLLKERGESMVALSSVLFFAGLARMIAPGTWGFVADRFQATGLLMRLGAWGAVLAYLLLLQPRTWLAGVGLLVFTLFRTPTSILTETIAFKRAEKTGDSYGSYRLWGTVGYILSTLLGGYIAQRFGAWTALAGGLTFQLMTACLTLLMPRIPPAPRLPILPALKQMVSRPAYLVFLASVMCHTVGLTTYDNFFPIHFDRLGLNREWIGWTVGLGASCEVAVMAVSGRLLARFKPGSVLLFANLVGVLRWLLTAWLTRPELLLLTQTLHGITFGAWYICSATWINREAPPEIKASAQGILTMASYGLGGVVATALGSTLGEHFGTPAQFIACAGLALVAGGLTVLAGRLQARAHGHA